jgi:aminoglycoside phosphotransferase
VEVDLGIGVVTKVSTNKDKLEDEKLWYLEMHNLIPLNIPKVYGFENLGDFARLEIEYIPGRNLAELAIQEDEKSIRATLDGELLSILLIFAQNVTRNVKVIEFSNEMYYLKTESRLKDLIKTGDKKVVKLILNGVELNGRYHPPILTVLESMQKQLKDLASTALYGPIHGDLCFSNIILRDKSEKVSLVDFFESNSSEFQ